MLTALIGGCSHGLPQLQPLAPLPDEPLCRVAVLPFTNESAYAQADRIVYKIFMAELIGSTRFDVVAEGDVSKAYRQLNIYPQQKPTYEQLRILADQLGVELMIIGNVIEASEVMAGRYSNARMTMTLQLIDAHSGRTLWNTYHKRDGMEYRKVMHFGLVTTISGLAQRMVREVLDLWLREGLKVCTDAS